MSDDMERQLADKLADGKITDADAEAVRDFADFLEHAGQPAGDYPSPDGMSPIRRLHAAGRDDLIVYALGEQSAEDAYWSGLEGDEAEANLHGVPPYDVSDVARRVLQGVTARRVLDLGCGRGRLTNHIAGILGDPQHVHGVDISRPALNRAVIDAEMAHLGNVHYWHGDGRHLPPGMSGQFDLAYSITMLQHIPHDAKWGYIREVEKRLKPGGVFVFTIAVGHEEMFLNHQISDREAFVDGLVDIFGTRPSIEHSDDPDWTWVTCTKAEA